MKTPENPPAFPEYDADGANLTTKKRGMSLRDWFAGKAMAALAPIMANQTPHPTKPGTIREELNIDDLARMTFKLADAMLAARHPEEPKP